MAQALDRLPRTSSKAKIPSSSPTNIDSNGKPGIPGSRIVMSVTNIVMIVCVCVWTATRIVVEFVNAVV